MVKPLGSDLVKDDLVHAFVQLLKDNEAEVRIASAGQVTGMCCQNRFALCKDTDLFSGT